MQESELLKALKQQLAFFEHGGYGRTFRSTWRPTLLIRDSPLCLNATFTQARPCRECILFSIVPPEKRNLLLPCHHIPLNQTGDTIAKLYAAGTQKGLDQTFHEWLCATIQKLERKEANTMPTLEVSTSISFKNILFLTDFTEASKAAGAYAVALGRRYGARLYPAHVVVPFVPTESDARMAPELLALAEESAHTQINDLFRGTGANYQELVAQGSIETAVPAWTARHGIDLIVVGTHGRKGIDRFFLGSTAETVFRNTNCPVLTVGPNVKPPKAEIDIHKILFATSLTKESEPALAYALSFAQDCSAELTVLHVVGDDIPVDRDPRIAAGMAREKLRKLVPPDTKLAHKPEFLVTEGNPAKGILECAKTEQPDLIVLGLSRKEKTSDHFQRGIAYKVISSAPCAVLTVR